MKQEEKTFVRRVIIIAGIAIALAMLYFLSDVLLLIFGSVLFAIILLTLAEFIKHHTKFSDKWSLVSSIASITFIITLAVFLINMTVSGQVDDLTHKIPEAWDSIKDKINDYDIGKQFLSQIKNFKADRGIIATFSNAAGILINGITSLILIIVAGIYIAADPGIYKRGFLKLIPEKNRAHAEDTIDCCYRALKLWLLEKIICMSFIAVFITVGLFIIGFPSAIALGLLAGMGEFIPYIGTLIAAIPALLLAINEGPQMVLWTLIVYIVVQQIQGSVVMPLIQQRIVELPPAVTIFALLVFAALLGPLGILFAEPLTVLFFVLIKKLYIRETLHERTKIPGEARESQ